MNEAGLNEADTRAELIDPTLKAAGWGVVEASRLRREVITLGRLRGAGKRAKQDIADYVLIYRGQKLAVIEAKKRSLPVTEGLAQAKRYAERLQTRFAYATNGDGVYRIDLRTGAEGDVTGYPSPDDLWAETFGSEQDSQNTWRQRFGAVPFEDKGGFWQARQKLSTGVDARNIRNIVLMRPVNSMIEFKQIIGRGTRLYDGKDYFTIYDFVKAYEHFNDPEWDGEPLAPEPCATCGNVPCTCAVNPPEPCAVCGEQPCVCEKEPPEPCEVCGELPCVCEKRRKVKVKLADGKERTIQHMSATSFWSPDGKPIAAAEFIQRLFGELPALFSDEDELRRLWGRPDTRGKLLEGLEEKGYGAAQLAEVGKLIEAENSDLYDVLAYIAFNQAPVTRAERVASHRETIFLGHDYRQQEFLRFVLDHYVARGVGELDTDKLPKLIELKYHSLGDAVQELGPAGRIRDVFIGFQQHLY